MNRFQGKVFNIDGKSWLGGQEIDLPKFFYPVAVACLFLFFPMEGLAYTSLAVVRNGLWAILFGEVAILGLIYLGDSLHGRGKSFDLVIGCAVILCIILALFTLTNNGSWLQYARKATYIIGPWLFLAEFGKYGFKPLLKVLTYTTLIVLTLNFVTMVAFLPFGSFRPEFGDTWLFGQKTFMRNFIFLVVLFCMLTDRLNQRQCSPLTIYAAVVGLASILLSRTVTTLLVYLLMLAVLAWGQLRGKLMPSILKPFTVIFALMQVGIVHLRAFTLFEAFIVKVLHRSMTLTYRTEAWDIAFKKIFENPFTGTGIQELQNSGFVVGYGKSLSNAHNEILDVWFKGGLFGLIVFAVLVLRCVAPLFREMDKWLRFVVSTVVGCFLIESVVGDIWFSPVFLLLYLCAYLPQWEPLFGELPEFVVADIITKDSVKDFVKSASSKLASLKKKNVEPAAQSGSKGARSQSQTSRMQSTRKSTGGRSRQERK